MERQRKLCDQICLLLTNHSDQIFSVKRTIAFLSQGTTLGPGTNILTDRNAQRSWPPLYLKNDDVVQACINSVIRSLIYPVVEGKTLAKLQGRLVCECGWTPETGALKRFC